MKVKDNVKALLSRVDVRRCSNNTQRVLIQMLRGNEWVSRDSLKVSSPSSRVRDLRTDRFGGFRIECQSARELGKGNSGTYYRLDPKTVTIGRLNRIFEGVITES
jgi:hypothetical protein